MAATDPAGRVAREERDVLDELARLQRELEQIRQRRREAADAFNALVSTFPRAAAAEVLTSRAASGRTLTGTRSSRLPGSTRAVETATQPPPPGAARMARARRSNMMLIVLPAAAMAVAITALVLLMQPRDAAGPSDVIPPGTSTTESSAVDVVAVGDARASAPPSAELMTVRQVWLRVVVDGARVVEREVPAGTSIPLNGADVVVRAGDAGAVRFLRRGEDQGPLGGDGAVVTRTFVVVPE